MDKFVIRTPREPPASSSVIRDAKRGIKTQSRIQDCPGVVNLRELKRLQSLLECGSSEENLGQVIGELIKKNPSSKVLEETRILSTLKRQRAASKEVNELYLRWKALQQRREQLKEDKVEVRYDAETEALRNKSRELMLTSVSKCFSKSNQVLLAEQRRVVFNLEKEVFRVCDKKSSKQYRRLSRKLTFALREARTCRKLFDDPEDFLRYYI